MKSSVTFEPSGQTVWVESGTTLHAAALAAGVPISIPCGGRGSCGACGVRVVAGTLEEPDAVELRRLARAPDHVRLACRALVNGAVTVRPLVALAKERSAVRSLPANARTAVGVDLGTTSVSAVAVDLDTGAEGPTFTVANRQAASGADVLSRVARASSDAQSLRKAAAESVAEAVTGALAGVASTPEAVVIAGNTAMESLLAGADVSSLGAYPFNAPVVPETVLVDGLPGGGAIQLPIIAAFVGGDTVACLLHSGIADSGRTELLVDLGTNAEIIVSSPRGLWVASAAAGPAFEGFGIECGGVAGPGSVVSVDWSPGAGWVVGTLNGIRPERLAGSGLFGAVALLRRLGHIDPDGRMRAEGPLESAFFVGDDGVVRVRLGDDGDVTLSQLDVRALQLAKAAVQVGVASVLEAADCLPHDLESVWLAGAFGAGLSAQDAVELGVLPEVELDRVVSMGNASLYGALAVAVTPELLVDARRLAGCAAHVELATDVGFQAALMDALALVPAGRSRREGE